jgi:uncharacterized protein involved in exopolysaccharide biosynthesis
MNEIREHPVTRPPDSLPMGVATEFWRLRLRILLVACILAGAGFSYGYLAPKQYDATVMISPVLEDSSTARLGGLGSLAAQYGGLASLAGINLPGRARKDEALAVLQSELLTQRYISENNLLQVLYSDEWDGVNRRWTSSDPPTLWKAYRLFDKRIRKVSEDRKSGLVILSIRWTDAATAARWANDLVRLTNSYLREKAIDESERNIKYLNEQATKNNIVEVQKAIASLLQDEINRQMLARGRDEYALKVIDPAFVPEKASSFGPKRLAAIGFATAVFGALLMLMARALLHD